MMPIIRVVGPRNGTGVIRAKRIQGWIQRIREAIDGAPIYLDLQRANPGRQVELKGQAIPILRLLHQEARRSGAIFVPVVHVGAATSSVAMKVAQESACFDGRGICIRYATDFVLTAGVSREQLLVSILESTGVDADEADLWVDFGYLNPDRVFLAPFAATVLNELFAIADWRRVIFTGTSVPPMMGGIAHGTVGSIDRREWALWNELKSTNISRLPIFGDYAIQNLVPPTDGHVSNMRANARYSTPDTTLISRGVDPIYPDGIREFGDLCRRLVSTHRVFPPGYSWGDEIIWDCANGVETSGSQSLWRGVGTSHHLKLVTDQLTGFQWLAYGGLGQDLPRLYG